MVHSYHPHGPVGSPSSSEAVNSAQNTPETKLTAFSPEERRSGYKVTSGGLMRPTNPPPFSLNVYPNASPSAKTTNVPTLGAGDPFVSASSSMSASHLPQSRRKLSPVASSFTPLGSGSREGSLFGNATRQNFFLPASTSNTSLGSFSTDVNGPSPRTSRFPGKLVAHDGHSASSADITPRPSKAIMASPHKKFLKVGQFSSDVQTSRYIFIKNVSPKTSVAELEQLFHRDFFPTMRSLGTNEILLTSSAWVSFWDIREAIKAYAKVKDLRPEWTIEFTGTAKYFNSLNEQDTSLPFEAQILIKADYGGPSEQFNAASIGTVLGELLTNHGEVMAMDLVEESPPVASYRAEFYSSVSVDPALQALNGFKIAHCVLAAHHYHEGNGDHFKVNHRPLIIGQDDTNLANAFGGLNLNGSVGGHGQNLSTLPHLQGGYGQGMVMNPSMFPPYNIVQPSTARSFAFHRGYNNNQGPAALDLHTTNFNGPDSTEASPFSPFFSPYPEYGMQSPIYTPFTPGAIGQERATPVPSVYRSACYPHNQRLSYKLTGRHSDYPSSHHNIVDVQRISQGLDVRTTIMLRNIPNKVDHAMLKDIVDETSRGKYDFMYLRIDFANNCNVGYAFINFEDPYHIIEFMNARAGVRWNRFNSDKVAEVSYATIQGRDCLIQKFRNSSVMLEHPSFRPKIFHTTGPLAGSEDIFPGPDNPSKMRRSVENAEHVGLFAPRAGQNFRDEQRRRRSQYDRGTRLAEMEDAYDIDRHAYRGELPPYYPATALRYRRSAPYLPNHPPVQEGA